MDRLEALRNDWHRATEKDRPNDAIKALVELEKLEPKEPRWSQRLGESYRRVNKTGDAVGAFVRAFEGYLVQGFLPRAIAMAKLVGSLDAARGDLLEKTLPRGGPAAPAPPVATKTAAAPPVPPPPREPSAPPRVAKPAPLARAADAQPDEVRFDDAPESSLAMLLVDFLGSDVVTLDVEEDDSPPTRPVSVESLVPSPDHVEAMATFRLFASLSRDALLALSNVAELVEFVPTAMIIVRNERAFALYAIISGTAKVIVANSPEIQLREGDIFGESVLLDEGQRQADVRAETPLMTLRIEKHALDDVMAEHPEVEAALFDLLARRLITNLMHTSPLFAAFEPSVRLELAQKFEVRRAEAGTVLAENGRRSDGLYVILAGNVVADAADGKPPTRIARGTAFGHASLLGAGTSDVTIEAATEAVLLRMPATGFAQLAALYPPALAHLADTANEPLPTSIR